MTQNKRLPGGEDILSLAMEDWEESITNMDAICERLKNLLSQDEATKEEYNFESDSLYARLDMAKIGEMHAANLLAIATSRGSIFTPEEREMAADGARLLMGFPVEGVTDEQEQQG